MRHDTLSDTLSRILNAERAGQSVADVRPASRLVGNVLRVMQEAGYIGPFEFVEDGRGAVYRVRLLGAINQCGAIKPRYAVKQREFDKWESRYLPAQDFGALIVSTTRGVVNHKLAKEEGVGGKLLAYVY